ncbi:MAG: methyl-accepting chemotaxis protein [Candidatus Riflebacteria bacterium]|nr:methyl-accepting chemotaxis protein [Candidatus Riflebacteria bacterium]
MEWFFEFIQSGSLGRRSLRFQFGMTILVIAVVATVILPYYAVRVSSQASADRAAADATAFARSVVDSVRAQVAGAGSLTVSDRTGLFLRWTAGLPDIIYVRVLDASGTGLAQYPERPAVDSPAPVRSTSGASGMGVAPVVTQVEHRLDVVVPVISQTGNLLGFIQLGRRINGDDDHFFRHWLGLMPGAVLVFLIAGILGLRLVLRIGTGLLEITGTVTAGATTGRLSTIEHIASRPLPEGPTDNELVLLSRAYNRLAEMIRKLTAQAQTIARDDQESSVLDERIPGDLGAAFARMVDNLRGLTAQAKTIARGEISTPILEGTSEGDLGKAFAQMLDTLRRIALQAQAIASCDLEAAVLRSSASGELGSTFSRMVVSLREILGQMSEAAAHLSRASQRVEGLCASQLEASSHQASSVNETSTAMEQMDATASHIAETASKVVKVAGETLAAAEAGKNAVEEVVEGIQEIRTFNQQSARLIGDLGRRSQKIGEVLGIINEIAGQTKLLSLNAAIEAARAGEAGRGFAIVAIEVRKLADNVVRSTHEIERMISDIRGMVNQVVASTTAGQQRVEAGVGKAERAGQSLAQILEMARRTTEFAQHISVSTQQQKDGSDQIVSVMRDMVSVCTRTADNARETAQAASELGELSSSLNKVAARFTIYRRFGATDRSGEGLTIGASPSRPVADTASLLASLKQD